MFGQILTKLTRFIHDTPADEGDPALTFTKIKSYSEYLRYANDREKKHIASFSFEKNLIFDTTRSFTYNAYCYVCKTFVDFIVDFNYAYTVDGILMPNWRERLECPNCRLNSRMRAAIHIFDLECRPNSNSSIYITEQTTALYCLLKQRISNVWGSEYLGDSVQYGNCNSDGVRNEDLTRLSFSNDQFDFILSFDVFEHIPNYKQALAACCRCLKAGGVLFFSVPFIQTSEKNTVRAYISKSGETVHLLPPEYHGDPMNSSGCLCYYHFGWEILDDLRAVGFKDSQALLYWSKEFGYLGGEQLMFAARKG